LRGFVPSALHAPVHGLRIIPRSRVMKPTSTSKMCIPLGSGQRIDLTRRPRFAFSFVVVALVFAAGCGEWGQRRTMEVSASAYNSVPEQTDSDPTTAAWGDELEPGMRAIAVSRDLFEEGLTRGVEVEIDELDGTWVVLDVMNARWERSIDIYMGEDVESAREWGRQDVTIRWRDDGA
jgi:3D (Asp-Asp-Asp) domain-containing protein